MTEGQRWYQRTEIVFGGSFYFQFTCMCTVQFTPSHAYSLQFNSSTVQFTSTVLLRGWNGPVLHKNDSFWRDRRCGGESLSAISLTATVNWLPTSVFEHGHVLVSHRWCLHTHTKITHETISTPMFVFTLLKWTRLLGPQYKTTLHNPPNWHLANLAAMSFGFPKWHIYSSDIAFATFGPHNTISIQTEPLFQSFWKTHSSFCCL